MIAILFGLLAALAWGGSDFCGAVASRKAGALKAVVYAELMGLALLLAALPLVREPLPAWPSLLFSFAAGLLGCLGLLILYRAMQAGPLSTAAPLSGLFSALVPIVFGALSEGMPGVLRLGGFGLALAAVWLFAWEERERPPGSAPGSQAGPQRWSKLLLPLVSGLCFGLYFVLMHTAGQHSTLWALIVGRSGGALGLSLGALLARRKPLWPLTFPRRLERGVLGLIGLAGLLDVSANLFYLLAGRAGRLDVAAVLSALYPGGTVLLAWLLLKERIQPRQTAGILAALAAIVCLTV